MTSVPTPTNVGLHPAISPVRLSARDAFAAAAEATKPGITRLVTVTAMVGFLASAAGHGVGSWAALIVAGLGCLVGTASSAAGANALNMWLEADRGGCMERTRKRPIPAGHLSGPAVFGLGFALSLIGPAVLVLTAGALPALISLACVMVYVLVYTPLKTRSRLSTLVGTVPGALPVLIGWTAAVPGATAGEAFAWGGLALFALMTIWQLPHFGAIAWMHRDDYERGGHRVVSAGDATGSRTARSVVFYSLLFVPAAVAPALTIGTPAGWAYGVVGLVGSGLMLWFAVRFARERTVRRARALFLSSVIVLPPMLGALVLAAMVAALL